MNPRSANCEADALATTPLRPSIVNNFQGKQVNCAVVIVLPHGLGMFAVAWTLLQKKRSSPPTRCLYNLEGEQISDEMSVELIFGLFHLRKYASDGQNLHVTHHCLIHLHLLSIQKLAQNSGTR